MTEPAVFSAVVRDRSHAAHSGSEGAGFMTDLMAGRGSLDDYAALRREGPEGARTLRRRHAIRIWLTGCLMALPLAIPVVNLLVPTLGAATFTHLYHRLAKR